MTCKGARRVIALQAVDEVWRVAHNCVETVLCRVLQHVAVDYLNSFSPWRVVGIYACLHGCLAVYFYTGNQCVAALCCHNGNEPGAATYVKHPFALAAVEPTAKQTPVGAHFHRAVALLNGELLEFEIAVRHCCSVE